MKRVVHATVLLGGSSVASIGLGLVCAKAYALLLGPEGVGRLGLLQGFVGFSVVLSGLGIGTGLVRNIAGALESGDEARVAVLRRAAAVVVWISGGTAALGLVLFRDTLSRWVLGSPAHGAVIALMAPALLLNLAAELQASVLNGFHRVAALARMTVIRSAINAAAGPLLVLFWGMDAVPALVVLTAFAGWGVSRTLLRREIRGAPVAAGTDAVVGSAASLIGFGAPLTASRIFGRGVHHLLPIVVLHELGEQSVGFYHAAVLISVNYLAFLLNAFGQDYYPRASAAAGDRKRLAALVNEQCRFVLLVSGPVILAALALAPPLVSVLYSPEFLPAALLLQWILVGDIARFAGWTLGYAVMAAGRARTYLFLQAAGGLNLFLSSWLGLRFFGLPGIGLGVLLTYVVHWVVVSIAARREIGVSSSTTNKLLLLVLLGAALSIQALPLVAPGWALPFGVTAAALCGGYSVSVIRGELRCPGGARVPRSSPTPGG